MTVATSLRRRSRSGRADGRAASGCGTSSAAPAQPLVLLHGLAGAARELGRAAAAARRAAIACSCPICPATAAPRRCRAARRWPTSPTSSPRWSSARTAARRSSPGTRSAGSSRCGWRSGGPSSCAACCSPRRRGSARATRSAQAAVLRHRHRAAGAAGSRRFATGSRRGCGTGGRSSGRGSCQTPLALSPRAAARLSRERRRARRHAHRRPRARPGRPAARARERGCPWSSLWGARDPQLPLDDAFEYARRLRAKLRVVADCGHLVIGERPDACLAALEELARALGSTRGHVTLRPLAGRRVLGLGRRPHGASTSDGMVEHAGLSQRAGRGEGGTRRRLRAAGRRWRLEDTHLWVVEDERGASVGTVFLGLRDRRRLAVRHHHRRGGSWAGASAAPTMIALEERGARARVRRRIGLNVWGGNASPARSIDPSGTSRSRWRCGSRSSPQTGFATSRNSHSIPNSIGKPLARAPARRAARVA